MIDMDLLRLKPRIDNLSNLIDRVSEVLKRTVVVIVVDND